MLRADAGQECDLRIVIAIVLTCILWFPGVIYAFYILFTDVRH